MVVSDSVSQKHENRKQWSIKATPSEGLINKKQIDSLCITLFDQETNVITFLHTRTWCSITSTTDIFDVGLNDSFIKGSYPAYKSHSGPFSQDIEIDFTIQAESFPYWVAQGATNGWIPMGLVVIALRIHPKNKDLWDNKNSCKLISP